MSDDLRLPTGIGAGAEVLPLTPPGSTSASSLVIVAPPQNIASERSPYSVQTASREGRQSTTLPSRIRECRRCMREIHALSLEVLAVLGSAAILWWHFRHDFELAPPSMPRTIPEESK
jgi:hypothetical protein